MDSEIIYRCDKVLQLLEEEPQELELGIRGEIVDQYEKLIRKERECMINIRAQIIRISDI